MMDESNRPDGTQPTSFDLSEGVRHLDAACERFEAEWRAGARGRPIEDHLAEVPEAGRRALLHELILIEAELRRGLGETPSPDDYRARFADYLGPIEAVLEQLESGPASSGFEGVSPGGRFRVKRKHAEGGLGIVYVALDQELRRDVALKTIKHPHGQDPESRVRFLLEAEVTGSLEHPGIVPVYGLSRDDGDRPYYAMRLIKGESLKESIASFHGAEASSSRDPGERSLEFRKLLSRFVDICQAVAYAHSRGVIHRDLKPANVMLGPYGETLVVDWGLAKLVGRPDRLEGRGVVAEEIEGDEPSLRPDFSSVAHPTRSAIGTPQYMSPEQANADPDQIGPRSDVYSLGAILYCLLTGRPPIEKAEIPVLLDRVRRGEYPSPRQVKPSVQPALEAICRKAMSLRPDDRHEGARRLADDVEQWLADEPVSSYREPLSQRIRRKLRRNRTLASAAAASLLVAILGLVAVAIVQARANGELSRANKHSLDRFQLARGAIGQFHQGASEELLRDTKGFSKLRAKLLGSALDFYRKLAADLEAQQVDDPSASLDLARAYEDLGGIIEEIGTKPAALDAYRRALTLLTRETEGRPAPLEVRLDRSRLTHAVGRVLDDMGQDGPARESYQQALRERQALFAEHPTDRTVRRDLATSHNDLGNLERKTDRSSEALASYQKAGDLRRSLVDSDVNDRAARSDLAESLSNIATIQFGEGKPDQAIQSCDESRALLQALQGLTGGEDDRISERLGKTLYNLALMRLNTGAAEAALSSMTQAAEVRRKLAEAHPAELRFQSDLALADMYIGQLHLAADRLGPAEEALRAAIKLQRPVVDADRQVPESRSDLSAMLDSLSTLQSTAKRIDEALQTMTEVLEIRERLVAENDKVFLYKTDLADSLGNAGRMQVDLGRKAEALASFRRASEIRRGVTGYEGLMLYNIACERSMSVPLLEGPEAARMADEAMEALKAAAAKGYRNLEQYKDDQTKALAALKDRDDFRALLRDLSVVPDPERRTR